MTELHIPAAPKAGQRVMLRAGSHKGTITRVTATGFTVTFDPREQHDGARRRRGGRYSYPLGYAARFELLTPARHGNTEAA